MLVHAATPKPIVDALHAASTQAVMSPEVRDKLRGVDTVPIALSPADQRPGCAATGRSGAA